ncbi:SCNM1 protein, partial [Ardeotis kori]|nr:SCNM1 protein [Ardeotis kori]
GMGWDGCSRSPLALSQKRRVADLLANYIPEDEALLLRSGRYACTVCAHRPVFDTLDVLTVHRAGKKHTSSKLWGPAAGWAVPNERVPPPLPPLSSVPSPQGSAAPLLARTRRIARSALLKAAPYSSCCRRTGAEGSRSQAGATRMGPSVAPPPPELLQKDGEAVDASPAALLPGHRGGRAGESLDAPKVAPARTQRGSKGKVSLPALSQPEALSPERRQALERYLQLRSAGWIQDRSGKWVKDENAEFDSDEDEPPALLLA